MSSELSGVRQLVRHVRQEPLGGTQPVPGEHESRGPDAAQLAAHPRQAARRQQGREAVAKQVEFAETIYSSGTDLLNLIDDILDLSKVEAGKMEVNPMDVPGHRSAHSPSARSVLWPIRSRFQFQVDDRAGCPAGDLHRRQRLQQVLKNLLSNAFKFTRAWHVTLRSSRGDAGCVSRAAASTALGAVIAFAVRDTGIGIPRDKQQLIFEAFQQADGTTSRKFGGTGLGLSISREMARLLGGEIASRARRARAARSRCICRWSGTERRGQHARATAAGRAQPQSDAECIGRRATPGAITTASGTQPWDDDARRSGDGSTAATPLARQAGDRRRPRRHRAGRPRGAIIENDVNFARILLDMARDKGFKGIVALDGEDGLELARKLPAGRDHARHRHAGMDGWAVLDRLKHDPDTRHIPVHIISGIGERQQGLKAGRDRLSREAGQPRRRWRIRSPRSRASSTSR